MKALGSIALLAIGVLLSEPVMGGVVVGTGNVAVFGRAATYATWDVLHDPSLGILEPAEGRASGLEFFDGKLYMAYNTTPLDGGPVVWTPGGAGSLASPTTRLVSISPPVPVSDPRRSFRVRRLTVNSSGAGYGAFASGAEPTLVASGIHAFAAGPALGATILAGVPNQTIGTPQSVPAQRVEYVPGLDQIVSSGGSTSDPEPNPMISTLRFSTHSALGIAAPLRAIEVAGGVRAVQSVSAGFASLLTGQSIGEGALLCLVANLIGASDPPELMLYSYQGVQLARANVALPRFNLWPLTEEVDPSAMAVDEANARLFIGDRATGWIHVVTIPAPSVAVWPLAVVLAARRRRGSGA